MVTDGSDDIHVLDAKTGKLTRKQRLDFWAIELCGNPRAREAWLDLPAQRVCTGVHAQALLELFMRTMQRRAGD